MLNSKMNGISIELPWGGGVFGHVNIELVNLIVHMGGSVFLEYTSINY